MQDQLPVAAFVISTWLTALDAVVCNTICSLPFASAIKPASANLGAVSTGLVSVLFSKSFSMSLYQKKMYRCLSVMADVTVTSRCS